MLSQDARRSLESVLGKAQLTTQPVELVTYEIDAGLDGGAPDAVVFPRSAEDVVCLVQWANEHNIPLIARGAGTGSSGGAVADRGGIIVEFSRMNRLLELDTQGRSAVVEPGILNLQLDELVKQQDLYYPPDPASQRACSIGGNVAENAGGPHCFKYGVTTNYIAGLQVVLADGRAVRIGGRAVDYPEYDLLGLIVGSEGTLALFTSITVRLVHNPPSIKTMMAVFDSLEQAGEAVSAVIAAGLVPATMEMMDQKITRIVEDYAAAGLPTDAAAVLIVEVDGYPSGLAEQIEEVADILQAHGGRDLRIAQSAEEREQIWYARKSASGAMSRLAPNRYVVDITVPRSRLAETLREVNEICDGYDLRAGHVFHAGDGNLHPLILITNPEDRHLIETIHRAAGEMIEVSVRKDGSLTGEHGIGIEKREFMPLMYSGAELAAMWDIKQVFDPRSLFNPGKMFPSQMPERAKSPCDGRVLDTIFTPTTMEEAAQGLVALSAAHRRVRICGQSPPPTSPPYNRGEENVWLSTTALSGIKTYAPDDLYVIVGAGTPLAELQTFLASDQKQVPLTSPWPAATIGGIVAANVNAPLRMRYGSIRDLVLAMSVVLADGRQIRAGRPVVKNVAGYDLPKVFVGSQGTLGLIADVTLKLTPLPRVRRTVRVLVDDLARGLVWAEQISSLALVASAIVVGKPRKSNIASPYLLTYTAEGIPEDVETELEQVREVLRANGAPSLVQVEAPSGTELWADLLGDHSDKALQVRIGIPPKDLAAYVQAQAASLETGAFLADRANGLVYAISAPDSPDAARAWLGALRHPALEAGGYAVVMNAPDRLCNALDLCGYRPETLDLMRSLKARWDPAHILSSDLFLEF